MRAAHLGAQASMLAFGLVIMFGVGGLFSMFVAMVSMFQVGGLKEVRAMVADPAAREVLLSDVRRMPADRADVRERIERDLSAEGVGRTVGRLDDLIARQQVEADRERGYLNRPERACWIARGMPDDPRAGDLSATELELILRAARRSTTVPAEAPRWAFFSSTPWRSWRRGRSSGRRSRSRSAAGWRMSLAGITLVRPDGRPAGRFRCAVRELLVWLPVTALLLANMWVQTAFPEQVALRTGLWLTAALLLPVYVMIALRNPAHPPQDRIMGTHLVPV